MEAIDCLLNGTSLEGLGLDGISMHPEEISEEQPAPYVVLTMAITDGLLAYNGAPLECVATFAPNCKSASHSIQLSISSKHVVCLCLMFVAGTTHIQQNVLYHLPT